MLVALFGPLVQSQSMAKIKTMLALRDVDVQIKFVHLKLKKKNKNKVVSHLCRQKMTRHKRFHLVNEVERVK